VGGVAAYIFGLAILLVCRWGLQYLRRGE